MKYASCLMAILCVVWSMPATAQTKAAAAPVATDIGTVSATGTSGGNPETSPAPGSAAYSAPSRAPLDATQPESVVSQHTIDRTVIPTQNYDSIIKFTPSVQNIEPVGPGLQQNFYETIRGFTYKQFNTTFDGLVVPGTISSFAPQSEGYFMAHDIGSVEVDRGPGTASTIGYATFGGTVSILSKPPSDTFTVNPYATVGSYKTVLRGVEVDTGLIPSIGGVRGYIDFQQLNSDGYLTATTTRRNNAFSRFDVPIGSNTVMTFVAMGNSSYNHTPGGATLAEIKTLGANYGLNRDPTSQAYTGYNHDNYEADFDYIRIRSELPDGWGLEDTPYTASYYHHGNVGLDPNGTTPNLTGKYYVGGSAMTLTDAVPGRATHSDFRDWGNSLRMTKDTAWGQARAGFWVDYEVGDAYRTEVLLSDGDLPYAKSATASAYDYRYRTTLTTLQPYLEYGARPLPGLVITPGLKFTDTIRGLDAAINQTTKVPAKFNNSYSALQPSVDARYTIMPGLVAYAQIAKGFLAPPLNVLQTTSPQTLNPQETWNYQTGLTWQTDSYTVSGDLYYIDFSNRIASQTIDGTTIYSNGGGAIYQGIELEGTYKVAYGVSLYANGTINEGYYKNPTAAGTGKQLATTPNRTAAIGPIIDANGFSAALLAKYIGKQYGQDTPVDAYPIKAYQTADFVMGYTLPIPNQRKIDFRLSVNNIFDSHAVTFLNGTSSGPGAPGLFFTVPGRSFFLSASAHI